MSDKGWREVPVLLDVVERYLVEDSVAGEVIFAKVLPIEGIEGAIGCLSRV
ncbi:hypothetical protein U6G28_07295 [Actinomycetaceae bacterium MB13-C1-2]|nr:hypothetical protein U6G28_07295 [Actinomycetaceae bacterium MB13-C1-2]